MDEIKTERSIGLIIFGLVFFAFGFGFFTFSAIPNIYDGWKMQSWLTTQATLTAGEMKSTYYDRKWTYEAVGQYNYSANGQVYNNDRISLSDGSDNVGDFQQRLGRKLARHFDSDKPITIWYNPNNPADSIVNRDIRWASVGFKFIFLLIFGGIGLAILVFAIKGKKVNTSAEAKLSPWLARPEWKNGSIKSDAKSGMYGVWFITSFWNLMSYTAAIPATIDVFQKQNYMALVSWLFPLFGLGLLYWAIKKTKEWKRFGTTLLTMDPYPGSINGHVGGHIQLNMPYDPKLKYKVTLNCVYSYSSGSGKNRSRHQTVKWQDQGYAKVKPAGQNIFLQFCFDVPDNLPISEEVSDSYHLWRLDLESEMDGTDLNRSFEIPVYNTQQHQTQIYSEFNSAEYQPIGVDKLTIQSLIPLKSNSSTPDIYYPMFRKPAMSLSLTLIGGIFLGVGLFLWQQAAKDDWTFSFVLFFMSSVFSFFGGAILIGGIYSAFNSLHIKLDGFNLHYKRKFLMFTLKNISIPYSEINDVNAKISSTSNTGRKHKVNYKVYANVNRDKFTLAEQIDSASKKDFVVDYFKQRILN